MKNVRKVSKKGNIIADMIIFVALLFVVILAFYVGSYFWKTAHTDLLENDLNVGGELNNTYSSVDGFVTGLSFLFILVVIGVLAFLVISAQQIDTSPGFFIFAFIGLILVIIIASYFANTFDEFRLEPELSEVNSDFSLANNVLLYFPLFILILGGIIMVVLYAKPK